MATKKSLTTAQAAAQLTRYDSSWSDYLKEHATVTYAYRASIPSGYEGDYIEASTFQRFTSSQIAISELIFKQFEDVAGITLTRVSGTDGYSDDATILLGNYADRANSDTYGYSYTVGYGDRSAASTDGDFWYNLRGPNDNGNSPNIRVGSDDYNTVMHELGHSLGLEHPTDYPDDFDYASDASYVEDSLQYTVMSYFDASETGAVFGGRYLKTLGLHDIAALQRLYGANMTTRTGNDTYGFGGDGVYGLSSASDKSVFSIWDAGGNDTLNFAKYSNKQVIDLNAEHFSSVGGLKYNVSIAKGVTIENAIGGSGADEITGNAVANKLEGRGGNDTLIGNGGNDKLYGGGGNDLLYGGTGKDTLSGGAGRDYFVFGGSALSKLGLDLILDFGKGDKITLLDTTFTVFDSDKKTGVSKADFSSGTSVKSMGKGDHLFYDTKDHWVYYDRDGAGTGAAAIKLAELDNNYKLAFNDFLIA
ncbi:M10 family metallopeptidase [Neorhizobium alkalisoli]|jgi:serralysin|uniref:Serralysin n=1 Tax=Neorhizobium alkalisoli TaxID=528178 RepID=A0A561R362_9HYPH|nr:M10 family metallopeptidase [Neorhizobium alkalisoli]TWF57068.1 serralysin [Neorhizobium alkalisoli]